MTGLPEIFSQPVTDMKKQPRTDMDLRLLHALNEVSRTRSFSKSAQAMGITQPHMSTRIRKIEEQIGFPVFHRTSRSVELTAEGRRFLPAIDHIFQAVENAQAVAEDIRRGGGDRLRVGTSPYYSETRWRVLSKWIKDHPDVTLVVEIYHSLNDLFQAVRDGTMDVGFALSPVPEEFDSLRIFGGVIGLLVPADSRLGRQEYIDPESLRGAKVAMFGRSESPWLHDRIMQAMKPYGLIWVEQPEDSESGMVFLARNIGTPVLCIRWWEDDQSTPPGVVHLPLSTQLVDFDYYVIRNHTPAQPAAKTLWQLAQRMAAREYSARDRRQAGGRAP